MTTYEVHPGVGIGPFAIGLTLDEVLIAAERHGFELSDWPDPDIVPFDGWLMLRLDAYERVARMEAVIPSVRDEKALVLGDILLGLPVNVVVPALDRLGYRLPHRAGVAVSEYPELGLSLFLDTNAQDPAKTCFEYVAVMPPWKVDPAAADLGPDPWNIHVNWLDRTPKPRS